MRLDVYLVDNGYFKTREKAKVAIKDECIYINEKMISKPSFEVSNTDTIEIKGISNPFVSRGGYKLEEAIKVFQLDFTDKIILDVGASTGGFTDCSLQYGARRVYAVDVGTSQLDEKLLFDQRVISLEQTNIKDVHELNDSIDFIVMDVSFVSIDQIIFHLKKFMKEYTKLICLIKPQFEAGIRYIGKNGIVKDKDIHKRILNEKINMIIKNNLYVHAIISSPIKGKGGNIEYLAFISNSNENKVFDVSKIVEDAFRK